MITSPTLRDIVKAKNMDLQIHKHNKDIQEIHSKKDIIEEKQLRAAKISYENIMARLDTDKNTKKKSGQYSYNIPIDTKHIIGINETNPTIMIRGV